VKIRTKVNDKGMEYKGLKVDGWEVVFGASAVVLVLAFFLPRAQMVLFYVSGGLFGLWLIGVIVVYIIGLVRKPTTPAPDAGGGTAHPPQAPPQPKQA
jgi:hypothetical protein